ncbi:MAG: multidrug effflux MFS transporter [Peptococcaceae bacterium]|jgi:DHA1 family bicyclomycin/chloramphenicol resistance-like MFS transporter|nr:multidrug effflux MFS transporter [Peptococcaceae bacterium]
MQERDGAKSVKDLKVPQKALGKRGFIIFLALMSAFPPLSTDLYLPALPLMTEYFQVPEYQVNLTLLLFFLVFAVTTLIWGPLSDKYGRKPVLLTGLVLYTLGSVLCAVALSNTQLIFYRCLQAAGGGAANTVATAIVKDEYHAQRRETILAIVQSMVVLAPAVAPVIGALLLRFTSWRGIFVVQALIGLVLFAASLVFKETLQEKTSGSVAQAMGRLIVVLKNPRFSVLLLIFSLLNVGLMAFIASSSYIYQNAYGLNSQVYSYYFAFNAVGCLLGPLVYLRLAAHFNRYQIINGGFMVLILSGTLICLFAGSAPWIFALVLLPATIVFGALRPPGTYLMLDQQKTDTGSAASLIGSAAMVMGSLGIVLVSLWMAHPVLSVGVIDITCGVLSGGLWLVLTKSRLLRSVRAK